MWDKVAMAVEKPNPRGTTKIEPEPIKGSQLNELASPDTKTNDLLSDIKGTSAFKKMIQALAKKLKMEPDEVAQALKEGTLNEEQMAIATQEIDAVNADPSVDELTIKNVPASQVLSKATQSGRLNQIENGSSFSTAA